MKGAMYTPPKGVKKLRRTSVMLPLLVLAVLVLCVFVGGRLLGRHKSLPVTASKKQSSSQQSGTKTQATPSDTIRLIATGDELPHDSVDANAKTATGYNYLPFF